MPDAPSETTDVEMDQEWEAELVGPDTLSDDDPTVTIPVGWWVFGYNRNDHRETELFVRGFYDITGEDVSERVARRIADFLTEEFGGGENGDKAASE